MLEVLKFIFSDIWHFIGTCILLAIIFNNGIINIKYKSNDDEYADE
jgi:hypothetical protein